MGRESVVINTREGWNDERAVLHDTDSCAMFALVSAWPLMQRFARSKSNLPPAHAPSFCFCLPKQSQPVTRHQDTLTRRAAHSTISSVRRSECTDIQMMQWCRRLHPKPHRTLFHTRDHVDCWAPVAMSLEPSPLSASNRHPLASQHRSCDDVSSHERFTSAV